MSQSSFVSVILRAITLLERYAELPSLPGLVSFNVFGLPSLIGGAIASVVVGLVFADYTRRPSFRVRSPGQAASFASARAKPQAGDPVTMWTYTTRRR